MAGESRLSVVGKQGEIEAEARAEGPVSLVYKSAYREGDKIVLTVPRGETDWVIRLEDTMESVLVYMAENTYTFPIPFGEQRLAYNPKSFGGDLHVLTARPAAPFEVTAYRNLAVNGYDTWENPCFPHAQANAQTRGESVFAARNAIDGNTENGSHGNWPYESWGIDRNPDAEITLTLGRTVLADRVVLYTRADFPHDNWWRQADLVFSDGSSMTVTMQKSAAPHSFVFAPKKISWVRLCKCVKCETDPSEFPALSQMEVYGRDISQNETIGENI